jgi:hypothetical protein
MAMEGIQEMCKVLLRAAAAAAVLALTACSSEPAKTESTAAAETSAKKEPSGPPEPVLAKTAFYEMYKPARSWAPDLLVLSLKSGEVAGVKNVDGKAGQWTAIFASPSLRAARTYTYAVADQLPGITKGVRAESTIPWAGGSANALPFQNGDIVIDSDAAYKAALEKSGSWVKTHPDRKVSFSLGSASRYPNPMWYVLWGNEKTGYAVLVNVVTGKASTK